MASNEKDDKINAQAARAKAVPKPPTKKKESPYQRIDDIFKKENLDKEWKKVLADERQVTTMRSELTDLKVADLRGKLDEAGKARIPELEKAIAKQGDAVKRAKAMLEPRVKQARKQALEQKLGSPEPDQTLESLLREEPSKQVDGKRTSKPEALVMREKLRAGFKGFRKKLNKIKETASSSEREETQSENAPPKPKSPQ